MHPDEVEKFEGNAAREAEALALLQEKGEGWRWAEPLAKAMQVGLLQSHFNRFQRVGLEMCWLCRLHGSTTAWFLNSISCYLDSL